MTIRAGMQRLSFEFYRGDLLLFAFKKSGPWKYPARRWELLSRQQTALQEVEFSFHFYHSQCHMVLTFMSLPFLMIQIRS